MQLHSPVPGLFQHRTIILSKSKKIISVQPKIIVL